MTGYMVIAGVVVALGAGSGLYYLGHKAAYERGWEECDESWDLRLSTQIRLDNAAAIRAESMVVAGSDLPPRGAGLPEQWWPPNPAPARLRLWRDGVPVALLRRGYGIARRAMRLRLHRPTWRFVVVDTPEGCPQPCTARHCADHAGIVGTVAQRRFSRAAEQMQVHAAFNLSTQEWSMAQVGLPPVPDSLLGLMDSAAGGAR